MNKVLKRIIIVVLALVVVVVAGTLIYTKIINKADKEFSQDDVDDRIDTSITDPASCAGAGSSLTPPGGVDGTWMICGDSEVGYRVNEKVNGIGTTANGRSKSVTGSIKITGTSVTGGEFKVDMTTFSSDESRRDRQFNGRIMEVSKFPTATFTLTSPIHFQQIPSEGGTVKASATGDLTLHGVTKKVTFDVSATFKNGRIGVLGQIPVTFADYDIENPSLVTVTTEDHGLLEFVLVLVRG